MKVIGTAGHVDHGKSTLVQALTGINPDRLIEEQIREMTIDLGFAWMQLPGGEEIGIVDVPGHRDFIKNMLAGVGGIDAVLLIIAADEGVMPQTREHLTIVDLLHIRAGIIVLTKIDLIHEQEWLELIETEVRSTVRGTVLQDAPIVRVSARSGEGLADLIRELDGLVAGLPPRINSGRPRLPVDRVFKMQGFGTIVTGTLIDGDLRVGQEVVILPSLQLARIRGLQTHKQKQSVVLNGSRTAINLSGISGDMIRRGETIALPGQYEPTRRVDVRLQVLPDSPFSLHHSHQVKMYIGTSEASARIRLLGVEIVYPGELCWAQLELGEPIVVARKDRFIIRQPSPETTLGGGEIIDPKPVGRYRRFDATIIDRLTALLNGIPEDILFEEISRNGGKSLAEISKQSKMPLSEAMESAVRLVNLGRIFNLSGDSAEVTAESIYMTVADAEKQTHRAKALLHEYHEMYPLRKGMPREELKNRLGLDNKLFALFINQWLKDLVLCESEKVVHLPNHSPKTKPEEEKTIRLLLETISKNPYTPPSVKECQDMLGMELFNYLLDQKILIQVSADVVFGMRDFDEMKTRVVRYLEEGNTITVAEYRDWYNSSRKYALAFLEYLDTIGVTLRDGDVRRLRKR